MTFRALDRAQMAVSGAPGTGNITLGSALIGFQTFAQAGITNGDTFSYVAVDGSNWEYGVATYATSGPTLTRAPTNTSAQTTSPISLTSSAVVLACLRAEDTIIRSPPSALVFNYTANGSSAASTATYVEGKQLSVFRSDTGISGTDKCAFRGKAVPASTPWIVTMQMRTAGANAQYLRAGLAIYDSVSGKIIILGVIPATAQPSLVSLYCANLTTFTTATGLYNLYNGEEIPSWFRIQFDGTTYSMFYSWDNSVWFLLTTYLAASFFTATHVGVGMQIFDVFNAAGVIVRDYYEG